MDQKKTFKRISGVLQKQLEELLMFIGTNMKGKKVMVDYLDGDNGSWTGIRDFLQDENLMVTFEWEEEIMNEYTIVIGLFNLSRNNDNDYWEMSITLSKDDKYFHLIPERIFKGLMTSSRMKESLEITL